MSRVPELHLELAGFLIPTARASDSVSDGLPCERIYAPASVHELERSLPLQPGVTSRYGCAT